MAGGGMSGTNVMGGTNLMAGGGMGGTNMMAGGGMSGTNLMGGTNLMAGGGMSGTNMMGGAMWWTNMSQMAGMANPQGWTNHHQVIAPNSGVGQMGPSTRPTGSQTGVPADMQSMMQRFQADRDVFTARQKAIETQMKGATEEQRQTLMMQMQGQMQQWKEQHAMMRQQMMDQLDQMKQQMMEQQRLMNQVVTPGAGSQQGGGKPGRPVGMGGR